MKGVYTPHTTWFVHARTHPLLSSQVVLETPTSGVTKASVHVDVIYSGAIAGTFALPPFAPADSHVKFSGFVAPDVLTLSSLMFAVGLYLLAVEVSFIMSLFWTL